ncbi:MAG: UDP-N-acetylmuramoyl-L-alanyl-D-glutamate--2,6-diaminopimelate ligase [Candidatus Omnitrophica bacterium]|jgi:UDP-N-acetylmuramoyl-L-alanyl-D-glutamate--2,6-diaminopimelate ligase|nr:UDP-N-acetylmuramoyl-L-alanyl-D-glutamate--2,6-diaminopimelate ligase [Candidatus Omnitrophota bacterium]
MKLKQLLPKVKFSGKAINTTIRGISDDSRYVSSGDLFFIMERKNFDIYSALKDIEPKIAAFVAETTQQRRLKGLLKNKPIIFVTGVKEHFKRAVDIFYGFKKNNFKFIGITGTNGKTTTAYLIYHILNKMQKKAALIGTIKYHLGSFTCQASNTTPGFLVLRKLFQKAKQKKINFIIMEVSSHAIEQNRISGINFSRCIFTNLSQEHLDYHKTMGKYFAAKKKLFLNNKTSLAIINTDDTYGKKLFSGLSRRLSFGIKAKAQFKADNVILDSKGTKFTLRIFTKTYSVKTSLLGMPNVLNILAAAATLYSLGFSLKKIIEAVASFKPVKGRLEKAAKDIFVDYAHTPDALEKVFLTLRDIGYERIICVFGCGGDRDRSKRSLMGKISSKYAYFTFITSDNPRSEDPVLISSQIESGFFNSNYAVVLDRKKAIFQAIKLFYQEKSIDPNRNVCLLVAGKGHEDYQIIGNKKIFFNDSNSIKEIVRNYKFSNK